MATPIPQGVSLHPIAARDGTQSSTFVSLQSPAPSEPHSAPARTPTKKNSHSRSQTERRPAVPHLPRHKASASANQFQPPTSKGEDHILTQQQEWGLVHADIEAYPVISEADVAKAAQVSSAASPSGPSTASAPVSPVSPHGVPPIRLLSAAQFAQIHRQHADADVPHHVVFPFLHGVDGDNVGQNIFFGAPVEGMPAPQYRGLTVVRADMPVPGAPVYPSSRKRASSSASKLSRYASTNRSRADSLATTASSFYAGSDDGAAVATPTGTAEGNLPWASSTTSISSATSSHMSSNSLFSVSTSDLDTSSRASTSYNDSGSKQRNRYESYDSQPKHSILNATIFPAELLHPPPALVAELLTSTPSSAAYSRSPPQVGGDVEGATFLTPRQASGVSLRNFRIQCVKYATISDIVIYCPAGLHEGVVELADWFRQAQQAWWDERCERRLGGLRYNVFIVHDSFDAFEREFPHLVAVDGSGFSRNRIDFIDREREEMQRLTACSEIDDNVWLGCSADVPCVDSSEDRVNSTASLESSLPEESNPNAFSVCINAYDGAEMPTSARLAHASHYLDAVEATALFELNSQAALRELEEDDDGVMSMISDDGRATVSLGPQGWSPSSSNVQKKNAIPASNSATTSIAGASVIPGPGRPARVVPNAENIVHLDCASTAQSCGSDTATNALIEDIVALCVWMKTQTCPRKQPASFSVPSSTQPQHSILHGALRGVGYNRNSSSTQQSSESPSRSQRSSTSSTNSSHQPVSRRILLHCGDGYTETSILALAYLMYSRQLSLPEAYLDLQGRANRSFFVYAKDLPFLKKLEQRIKADWKVLANPQGRSDRGASSNSSLHGSDAVGQAADQPSQSPSTRLKSRHSFWTQSSSNSVNDDRRVDEERERHSSSGTRRILGRGSSASRRRSSSSSMDSRHDSSSSDSKPVVEQTLWARGIAAASGLVSAASQGSKDAKRVPTLSTPTSAAAVPVQIPSRANTPTPQSSSAGSASGASAASAKASHGWFTHERFEGSLPSRILPFLYLGNLNHAINADMLHALGITHVVSVGETALNPPPASTISSVGLTKYASGEMGPASPAQLPAPAASSNSLWAEHRAGRISVLDLKNVSDDGIDPLRSAMTEAVEYIERARRSGGKVLVHCRVGVSRSSTIVLAYVMAHLDLSLVESYLLVRSRRLNILIQPHLLFFWELRGWETYLVRLKAARARVAIEACRAKSRRASTQDAVMDSADDTKDQANAHITTSMEAMDLSDSPQTPNLGDISLKRDISPSPSYSSHASTRSDMSISTSSRSSLSAPGTDASLESAPDLSTLAPLDVDLGAGAGFPYGFEVPNVEKLPFGTGSVAGLPAQSLRLPWGFLAREITSLNSRYLID